MPPRRIAAQRRATRIYLAGPEVFLPDALAVGRRKIALAEKQGFVGHYPLDASLKLRGLSKLQKAQRISAANEALMLESDALIANLTPFRGVSMDSGTAFEVGFMRARGKPVLGYTNVVADYAARVRAFQKKGLHAGDGDRKDLEIEDFDGAENLMITAAIEDCGGIVIRSAVAPGTEIEDVAGFEMCLLQLQKLLKRR